MDDSYPLEMLHQHETKYRTALLRAIDSLWEKRMKDFDSEEEYFAEGEGHSSRYPTSIPDMRREIQMRYKSWERDENVRKEREDHGNPPTQREVFLRNEWEKVRGEWEIAVTCADVDRSIEIETEFAKEHEDGDTPCSFTASEWVRADKNLVYLITHENDPNMAYLKKFRNDVDTAYLKALRAEWIRLALVNNDWLWIFRTKESYGKAMRYEAGLVE